jgi:hypothetical protein
VAELWLVDGKANSIEVRTASGPRTLADTLESDVLPDVFRRE